jgi:DNA-binding response OmpR family regulator
VRILLIEDEPLIAMSAEASLTSAGHEVVGPFKTHGDALNAAIREKPDLAMVDINLAGHNEGIGIVRDLLDRVGVRSFFATGQPNVARQNREAALAVLQKPYTQEDLVDAIPVLETILAGQSPPPPRLPTGLELFA